MLLSTITHGAITVLNVWDHPLWAWRQYARLHDDYLAKQQEGSHR